MTHHRTTLLALIFSALFFLSVPIVNAATLTVTNPSNSGAGSLRDAVALANAGDVIVFNLPLPNTIAITSFISINKNLTVQGPGSNLLTLTSGTGSNFFQLTPAGTATISGLTFDNCTPNGSGGAINSSGVLNVQACAFTNCSSQNFGGAITNQAGTLAVTNSTFSNCSSVPGQAGGAINLNTVAAITNCTFINNSAGFGGAINLINGATLTLTNSTFTGNTAATGGSGGAIILFNPTDALTMTNCTVTGNAASSGSGISSSGTLTVTNSIIAGNSVSDISNSGALNVTYSLVGSNVGNGLVNGVNNNIVGVAANLGSLQLNGGLTSTFLPNAGSPAIDAGNNAAAPTTDQRGRPRIFNTTVDMGATESGAVGLFFVFNTADNGFGTLREAITNAVSGDTIVFQPQPSATITLTGGEFFILKNLTIQGQPNLTISGNNASRIFNINSATLNLSDLILGNGSSASGGGGAIANSGTLTLTRCELRNNAQLLSGGGGAIRNFSGAFLTLNACVLNGNTAINGGGALRNEGIAILNQCAISNNNSTSGEPGGGIANVFGGNINMTGCTVSNNTASFGAGVFNFSASTLTMTNCTVSNNTALGSGGGGIFNTTGSTLTMTNCTVTANAAPDFGGIFNDASTVNLYNTIVAANGGLSPDLFIDGPSTVQHSLIQNAAGNATVNGDNGNVVGIPANLDTLKDNGGLTKTVALLGGSPAIDAGNDAFASTAGIATDQRGLARFTDGDNNGATSTDIGAFEAPPQTSWNPPPPLPGNTTATLNGLAASNNAFITVGDSGNIFVSVNGASWSATSPDYTALGFTAPPVLKSIVVDSTFNPFFVPTSKGNAAQSTQGFGSAVAVGVGGTILRTNDGGTTWSVASSGTARDLSGIAAPSTFGTLAGAAKGNGLQSANGFGSAVAVGVGGTILRSTNDGLSWTAAASGTTSALNSVAVSDDFPNAATKGNTASGTLGTNGFGSAVAVGVGGTILRSNDGLNWTAAASNTTDNLNAVAVVNDGTQRKGNGTQGVNGFGSAVAVGVGGTILRTTDGSNWANISANITGGAPLLLSFQAVAGLNTNTWFITGDGGAIYKTTDFGGTWTNLSAPGGASLNAVAFAPNGNGVVAGSGATIYASPSGGTLSASGGGASSSKPSAFELRQNYPNPFNPSTTISYIIPQPAAVRLVIYDVLGRQVRTLINAKQAAGNYTVNFNAGGLASGVYFYRLQMQSAQGTALLTKKMLLVK